MTSSRTSWRGVVGLLALAGAAAGCGSDQGPGTGDPPFQWNLPADFPTPKVPDDNPMTTSKVALGRHLFYDRRLSITRNFSCASCHEQRRGFTDNRAFGFGATRQEHPRNTMSLTNVAYASVQNWANPTTETLEEQAILPLFGETPVEHGLAGREDEVIALLREDATYRKLFPASFPGVSQPVSIVNMLKAIGAFQRTMISGNSPYDRYTRGDASAISAAAKAGADLFFGERLNCVRCHGGFNFTAATDYVGKDAVPADSEYFNTGLYNVNGTGDYPENNPGLKEFTGVAADMGRFKPPTLRNIDVTAPYMHDGSSSTLNEVLDHYIAGGRTVTLEPYQGVGADNPYKSPLVSPFTLTAEERAGMMAFLRSLTDSTFLTDTSLANPWPPGGPGGP